VNGKVCVAGLATDGYGTKIYAVESKTGNIVCKHYIEDTAELMDQGGVVVTKEGYIVAGLNFTNGHDDGGIIIVDPSTEDGRMVARYRVQEKVSGAPAIDAAGNIHFGTESGNYYVVDKTCKLVAKKDLTELINSDDRYKADMTFEASKVYSSVVIGDDGKVFLQFTNNDENKKREFGAIVCLEVGGCTGVGNTPWPMFGQNRRHTGCEK
jgi:outer membrane protein assembly factor BamB